MLSSVATVLAIAICLSGLTDARHLLEDDKSTYSVLDKLRCKQTFSILKAAVSEAGLADALSDPDADITIFAPTNTAFAEALEELGITADELLESKKLADILKYHVISGKTKSDEIPEGKTKVATLLGPDLEIDNEEDSIMINTATVQYADIEADNGVIHVINKVLLPPAEPLEDSTEDSSEEGPLLG